MNPILVLGGGYAGSLAALRLAKRGIPVILVDASDGLVERIRLHQVLAGDEIPVTPYASLFRNLPVEFVRGRVIRIDRERRIVETSAGDLAYERLVFALGSSGGPHGRLKPASTLAVVGGGLTGIETAAEIAERFPHIAVTLIDAGTIGANLSDGASRHLRGWMGAHNVTLRENDRVERVDADTVLWCTGFKASPIARHAGLDVNARGQIIVDENLRSSDPNIFAAGDAAAFGSVRMSCASALPMGAYVADVISGTTVEPFRFAFAGQCISLGRRDGIIQFVRPDDSPRDVFLSGRPAAWMKELVCRYALTSLRLERAGVHYSWPKAAPA
jgi:NADH dehydrogenase